MNAKTKETNQEKKYSPQEFLKAIDKLSGEMGYGLNYSPEFFQQDNGTFSLRIVVSVIKK